MYSYSIHTHYKCFFISNLSNITLSITKNAPFDTSNLQKCPLPNPKLSPDDFVNHILKNVNTCKFEIVQFTFKESSGRIFTSLLENSSDPGYSPLFANVSVHRFLE